MWFAMLVCGSPGVGSVPMTQAVIAAACVTSETTTLAATSDFALFRIQERIIGRHPERSERAAAALQVPFLQQRDVMPFVPRNDVEQRAHRHLGAVRRAPPLERLVVEMLCEMDRRGAHDLKFLEQIAERSRAEVAV